MAAKIRPSTNSSAGFWKLAAILFVAVLLAALIAWFRARTAGDAPSKAEGFRARNGRRGAAAARRATERFQGAAPADVDDDAATIVSASDVGVPAASSMPSASSASSSDAWAPGSPAPVESPANELYLPVAAPSSKASSKSSDDADAFPADRLTPADLLPKDAANSKWAQANPAGQGDIKDQNFLTAGYHIGFNTQGGSLRNASHDLRSTPPNPRYNVSVWQQSTITADTMRRPLN